MFSSRVFSSCNLIESEFSLKRIYKSYSKSYFYHSTSSDLSEKKSKFILFEISPPRVPPTTRTP